MSAFFDQIADRADWQSGTQRHPAAPSRSKSRKRESAALLMKSLTRSQRGALLSKIVENEILPRLAVARGVAASKANWVEETYRATEDDTAELVRLLLTEEASSAIAFMEVLQRRGATPAALYLGVMSQAARRLGNLWEDDRADFALVTIGMGRLQQVVRALSPAFQLTAVTRAHPETVLLLSAPGAQHTFGLIILAEFFRRESWHVIGGPGRYDDSTLAALVGDTWVDVVGFSIGSVGQLEDLTRSIRLVRLASRNRDVGVMVGGPLLLQRPDLVARVGADMTAPDAESAVRQASGLLAMRTAAD